MVLSGKAISLVFAKQSHRSIVYEMLTASEVAVMMFDEQYPAPSFEAFYEDDHYYTGEPNARGSYLLIVKNDDIIGAMSYASYEGTVRFCELDIWFKSFDYTGKGLGVEALQLVIEFVNQTYNIHTFIMRPWIKNTVAIKAYKKCGFNEFKQTILKAWYSEADYNVYGEGDYGLEDTVNLMLELKTP